MVLDQTRKHLIPQTQNLAVASLAKQANFDPSQSVDMAKNVKQKHQQQYQQVALSCPLQSESLRAKRCSIVKPYTACHAVFCLQKAEIVQSAVQISPDFLLKKKMTHKVILGYPTLAPNNRLIFISCSV